MARIAILGISIESNAFAPTASIQSFRDYAYLEGEEILSAGVVDYWLGVNSGHGFVPAMNRLRPWTPLPILIADGQASGAVEHSDYQAIRANLLRRLADSLPVDAVYIVAHGAGRTTELDDLDGDYFAAVRELVGDAIPIVATLDLHANLTPEMVAACDALVSQRTNPHVDSEARAEDAALLIDRMIDGWRPLQVAVRLPMLTPQVSQLTDSGEPLGVIVAQAEESLARGDCVGVSIIPGFSFADTPENGFWLYALGDDEPKLVMTLSDLAQDVWRMKTRFVRSTLSVERAVQIAAEPGLSGEATDGPVVFADIADNPGGGATGNTTWLLKAFLDAGVTGGVFAPFIDNDLVATAMQVGMGGEFLARFNATSESVFSRRLDAPAKVRWLGIGDYDSRYGVYAGSRVPLGECCVLEVGGNLVVVTSVQQQLLGADFISHFGIDVAAARFIVAKSRGHFRAGFAHMVDSRRIFEVDTPGLTTATLSDVPWRSLTRPIAPLDEIESWEPELRIVRPRHASG
ncbi:MAG: M81 family metallopeptidase [Pseudomonadota bacterium]